MSPTNVTKTSYLSITPKSVINRPGSTVSRALDTYTRPLSPSHHTNSMKSVSNTDNVLNHLLMKIRLDMFDHSIQMAVSVVLNTQRKGTDNENISLMIVLWE